MKCVQRDEMFKKSGLKLKRIAFPDNSTITRRVISCVRLKLKYWSYINTVELNI